MKKTTLLFLAMMAGMSSFAQTVNIHFQNGTTVNFHEDLIESIDFSEKTPDPTVTAGEAVDLGLSVMWASCNLGATLPEEAGGYYAWGETSEKDTYDLSNYAYYNASTTEYTNIGVHISGTEYDAAYVNLGKGWKMPSYDQFYELETKCTWEWTSKNGILGYVVTGNNGNSIFIPAVGYKISSWSYYYNERGSYWCDYENNASSAQYFNMSSSTHTVANWFAQSKHYGLTIRPIISYDDYNGTTDYDDSAITSNVTAYYGGGSIYSINGIIKSGSSLNFFFKNGSTEEVTLTGIQIKDGEDGELGSNMLTSNTIVPAGETNGYTITLGKNMTLPICRFTYMYNHHTYYVEAEYQSFNFAIGKMHELRAE